LTILSLYVRTAGIQYFIKTDRRLIAGRRRGRIRASWNLVTQALQHKLMAPELVKELIASRADLAESARQHGLACPAGADATRGRLEAEGSEPFRAMEGPASPAVRTGRRLARSIK
jgi:hypothetical protein